MNSLADYIIPSSAQKIMTELMNTRMPTLKYFTTNGSKNDGPTTDTNTAIGTFIMTVTPTVMLPTSDLITFYWAAQQTLYDHFLLGRPTDLLLLIL